MYAYDKSYLEDSMANLGAMLDYAVAQCGEPLELFWSRFLASGAADQFSLRNPKYLAGMSGTEIAILVASKTGDSLPRKVARIDIGSPEYWTGWTMAYLGWSLNMSFKQIEHAGLHITSLFNAYPTLHEADLSRSVSFAKKQIEKSKRQILKEARKNAGLSQKRLSEITGIPLRTIRAYEQGQADIKKAGAVNLFSLCSALGCSQECLIGG